MNSNSLVRFSAVLMCASIVRVCMASAASETVIYLQRGFAVCAASLALVWIAPIGAQAATFKILWSFNGGDGANPAASLIADSAGNLYGTTYGGPCPAGFGGGCGMVFELLAPPPGSTTWSEKLLYGFADRDGDGGFPMGNVRFAGGNLYGTTTQGGRSCPGQRALGCGTVFELEPPSSGSVWIEKQLYAFAGEAGLNPTTGLFVGRGGTIFGTQPGRNVYGSHLDDGTVFQISASGEFKTILSFSGYPHDGTIPSGNLVFYQGDFYGLTLGGGESTGTSVADAGTIFQMLPDGKENVLYSFGDVLGGGAADGQQPIGSVTIDSKGNLWGATTLGGVYGRGTVWKYANGFESVVYSFCAKSPTCADGAWPLAGLVTDEAGNFYGTTGWGGGPGCRGEYGCGTVFKITPTGLETVLHYFGRGAHGSWPTAALLRRGGLLYGTTYSGGANSLICGDGGCGTVFSIKP